MSTREWNTLVQPETLAAALGAPGLVVVDCRFSLADPAAGEREYGRARIPGARYAHLDRDLSGPHGPGCGRHPWPDAEAFTGRLSAWGISPRTRVVAYDAGDGAFAARLWCLLRMLGHEAVAVLDGGFARWTALGLPVDDAVSEPAPEPAVFAGAFDASRLLDADAIACHLAQGGLLVDARAPERFRGEVEPIDPRAGHIPGARNAPTTENLGPDQRFLDPAALRARYAELGLPDGAEVAVYCGSGVTAAHAAAALTVAGYRPVLYPGSFSQWSNRADLPVETA